MQNYLLSADVPEMLLFHLEQKFKTQGIEAVCCGVPVNKRGDAVNYGVGMGTILAKIRITHSGEVAFALRTIQNLAIRVSDLNNTRPFHPWPS